MPRRYLLYPLAVAMLLAPAAGTKAQYYNLDGAYRCLTAPDKSCAAGAAPTPPLPPPKAPPPPTLDEVIARARQEKLAPGDLAILDRFVTAKDPRAVEILAWCKLNGIGAPADPVAAYDLYGEAAMLGVPNAKRNQLAIYQTRLSSEQRQQMLLREDAK